MKVLIDANIFTRTQKTGVDYYTLGLVLAAAHAMPQDQFILAHFGMAKIKIPQDVKNIQIKSIWWLPSKMYSLYRHYFKFLPLELFMPVRADVMFFPDFSCPVTIQKSPKIAVIHDLVYLLQPEYVPEKHQKFLKSVVHQALQQADRIVVNSKSTKQDIAQAYDYPELSISVISPAVDHDQYKPVNKEQIDSVKQKYNIKGNYILFLSTLEPRKNVAGIIKAYEMLDNKTRANYQLVLAGKKGWLDKEIDALCAKMGDRVLRTGRVQTKDKAALYSGASLFAFPSAYEGFGMPILEAMACGVPVVTSNVSSMPEVAGNAAVLVDPKDTQAISQAFSKVLADHKYAQQLLSLGIQRAKQSSWDKSGQELAKLLRSLIKN